MLEESLGSHIYPIRILIETASAMSSRFAGRTRFRGQSYLKIGWKWVERALSRGYDLITRLHLSAEADPEPAMASRRQAQKRPRRVLALECSEAVA
jgi:hypothetical protein